jgi:hypothetical protein
MNPPAIDLAVWLKTQRKQRGAVARVFAGQLELAPAKYAELEAGVVRWLSARQEELIPQVLGLSKDEVGVFTALLAKARAAKPLEFADVFTREQLEPVRLRQNKRQQLTTATKNRILDAVFQPLA